jgi:hypothetical protein
MRCWRSGGKSATAMGKEGASGVGREGCLMSARAREVDGAWREIHNASCVLVATFFIVHPLNVARQRPVCCSNQCCVAFAMRNGGQSTALLCGTGHGKCSVSCSGYTKNCLDGQRCPRFHLPAGLHYILFI